MTNWKKILSWADTELKVGDKVRIIATSEMLAGIAIGSFDFQQIVLNNVLKVINIQQDEWYKHSINGRGTIGTITCVDTLFGNRRTWYFPYVNWQLWMEVV